MRESRLDNGVRVVTEPVAGVRSAAIGVWVAQGSAHESGSQLGISHLLEHLVFKGTERRSARDIALSLESLGGGLDAYTTREHTSYQARVLDEHWLDALDVLADLVLAPRLDPTDLELERAVVLEEIASVEDQPDDIVFDLHGERFWQGHAYGHAILGTRDTVAGIEVDEVRGLHVERYRGGNILVACTGSIHHDLLVEHADRLFGGAPARDRRAEVERPGNTAVGRDHVRRDTAQAHLVVANRTPPHTDRLRDALILIQGAFGGGMSSRMFQRIREEMALAYSVYAYQSFYSRAGTAGVYVGTRPAALAEAIDAVWNEYGLLHREGLTAAELEQAKSQGKGQMLLSMESTLARLLRLAGYAQRGEPYRSVEESLSRMDAVSLDDVNEACTRFFDPEDQYVLSLGP